MEAGLIFLPLLPYLTFHAIRKWARHYRPPVRLWASRYKSNFIFHHASEKLNQKHWLPSVSDLHSVYTAIQCIALALWLITGLKKGQSKVAWVNGATVGTFVTALWNSYESFHLYANWVKSSDCGWDNGQGFQYLLFLLARVVYVILSNNSFTLPVSHILLTIESFCMKWDAFMYYAVSVVRA